MSTPDDPVTVWIADDGTAGESRLAAWLAFNGFTGPEDDGTAWGGRWRQGPVTVWTAEDDRLVRIQVWPKGAPAWSAVFTDAPADQVTASVRLALGRAAPALAHPFDRPGP